MRHMADYSQKEKELEREHLEKLVKEEDRSIKPMKEFESQCAQISPFRRYFSY